MSPEQREFLSERAAAAALSHISTGLSLHYNERIEQVTDEVREITHATVASIIAVVLADLDDEAFADSLKTVCELAIVGRQSVLRET